MGFRQITELVQSALEQPFACELTGADGIDGFFCLVIEVRVRCGVYKGQDTVELVRFKDLVHNQGIFPADVEQNKSDLQLLLASGQVLLRLLPRLGGRSGGFGLGLGLGAGGCERLYPFNGELWVS